MVDSLDPAPQRGEAAEPYPLIAIVGPTAAGKSELSLFLAESLDGEIVNYDSVQVYRGFNIGTGKVPLEARRGIPHHLLDLKDPSELFTAGDFRREALAALAGMRGRGKLPILVGGTGLYLRALLLGLFEGPRRSEELRTRLGLLRERRGREFLHRLLERLDSQSAARIHPRDTQKIIRAVEVCLLARRPLSAALSNGRSGLRFFHTLKIGLNPDRGKLSERINQRVEQMFAGGLLDETRILLARRDAARIKPLEALGYRQASAALRGGISLEEVVRQTQAATRQYAKRQMTWFRREPGVQWCAGFGDDPEVQREILAWLEGSRVSRGTRTATPFPGVSTS
jgi:tRNA dimethylallyltransferase